MEAFADRVLALAARRAAWAEVYAAGEEETPVAFEANRLRSIETRQSRGVALRVVVDGRIGFASSSRLDDPQALVDDALATARFGAAAALAYPTAQVEDAGLDLYDETLLSLSVEAMVQMGQQMVDGVREQGDDLLCDVDLRRSVASVAVANSSGGLGRYRQTTLSLGLHVNRVRGTDILDIYESDASCHLQTLERSRLVTAVREKLELAEEIVPIRTGTLPVLFTPKGAAMTLLAPLAAALNGKTVLEGASPLAGRLGEDLFDARFSLYDDGRVPNLPTSAPCDGEGVPTRRTPLVAEGRLNAYYYDLQTAGLAGAESTGNGQRGLSSLPSPGVHALRVLPGRSSYQTMLADMAEGLLVDQTMGAWAGNLLAGDFGGNVHLGLKVERGRLVGRVKDTMLAGNVFRALRELQGIGDRAEWVGGSIEVPHLCFPGLSISAR